MKGKKITIWAAVMVLVCILFTADQLVRAAPSGELKLASQYWGHEVHIPRLNSRPPVFNFLNDSLFVSTLDGKLDPDRGLVEKWDLSPDGLTWTWTIRKGIKFHDGVEMTSKDVKFSLNQFKLPDTKTGGADILKQNVKSIDIKDRYTVVVNCNKPSLFLPEYLSPIESILGMVIPKDYYERVGQDEFIKNPIGSGPYKWHSQQIGEFIKLEAAGKHWRDGVPKYKYVKFLIIPEETSRIGMVKTGQADVAQISRASYKQGLAKGLNVIRKKNAGLVVMTPNKQWIKNTAMNNVKFRKALNLAIDREAILQQIFAGMGSTFAMYPGPSAAGCGGDPTLKPYPYNPEEAKKLLKESGYEGHAFDFYTYNRTRAPEVPLVAETVAGFWQEIGLKPNLKLVEWRKFRAMQRGGKTDNAINGHDKSVNPTCSSFLRNSWEEYHSSELRRITTDPKLDKWYEAAASSLDPAEIARLLGIIYRYTYDNYLMIPISTIDAVIITSKDIPAWDPGVGRYQYNFNFITRQQ